MKKQILFLSSLLSLLLIVAISCKNDQGLDEVLNDTETTLLDKEEPIIDHGYHAELEAYANSLGVVLDDPEPISFELPDGTFQEMYLIEEDIVVSREQLIQLREEASADRQFRTRNIMDNFPRTIQVLGFNAGGNALTNNMRTTLGWAVNNYNALNSGLNFTLRFGSDWWNADIVVFQVNNAGAGGRAGFPNGCNPFKWVQINSGTDTRPLNVIEHVITHEIGHCLGMRHTDWFSRASCGGFNNEGQGDEGAIQIPGTPANIDWNSVMLACFNNGEDGEFGPLDRVALETLYPNDNSRVQLFEGNNATQDLLGTINVAFDKDIRFTDGENCYKNDEARSARLLNMRAGQQIVLFDDSNPTGIFTDTRDDYIHITVLSNFNSYTINTFQQDINDQFISADYCCGGNLDGKVSFFRSRN